MPAAVEDVRTPNESIQACDMKGTGFWRLRLHSHGKAQLEAETVRAFAPDTVLE